MTKTPFSQHIRLFFADALLGLGLFFIAATVTVGSTSFAGSTLLEDVGEAAVKVADASVSSPRILMLAAVGSVLFALNSAFFRHLRRSHAVPPRPQIQAQTENGE